MGARTLRFAGWRFGPLFFFWAAVGIAAGPGDYVGAAACGACHAAEKASQAGTAHANALKRTESGQHGDWAFGAGLQAITFVTRMPPDSYREDGLSWYRKANGEAITPGQKDSNGVVFRTFDPAARVLSCFACHSTGPVTLDEKQEVTPHELGVRCEVCHGPGAAHVKDPPHNRLRTPVQMGAAGMNKFCGECHRTDGENGAELTDLTDWRNARDQTLRLAASACFRRSLGRLNCVTCHNPHQALEQNASAYDARCVKCHVKPAHRESIAGQACVTCHMPPIPEGPYLAFANHRIAVYAPANPLIPVARQAGR